MGVTLDALERCQLCPRRCCALRARGKIGFCRGYTRARVARAALHHWEEPCISGTRGSGTIFFSSCTLRCVYCQNHQISSGIVGLEVSQERLRDIMLDLADQGAHNINAVTPTHFSPHLIDAYHRAREQGLTLPLIYNTSGYELGNIVDDLAQDVSVWLTDLKYASSDLAQKYSGVANYPRYAFAAVERMAARVADAGGFSFTNEGLMTRGVIVRHLVLPTHIQDSYEVVERLWYLCGNDVVLSLMNQYTPMPRACERFPELDARIDQAEYMKLVDHAHNLGFKRVFWQEEESAYEEFVPAFDLTGVMPS